MYATQWWVLGKISRKVKYQQNKPVKHLTVNSIKKKKKKKKKKLRI